MKRWIILLGAILLLLTGCGSKQQVGLCLRERDDPVTAQYCESLMQALEAEGYTVSVVDAGDDQSDQDRQVAELMREKTDILILEPVMVTALENVVSQAQSADIPVVFINREPDAAVLESWQGLCYVGCDPIQSGLLQGQLVQGLPNGGDINGDGILAYGVIAGPEDHMDSQLRSQGCIQALKDSGIQAEQLALEYGLWSREDAQRRCANLLAKYGKDMEVLFCGSDQLALGAMDAIADGGRTVGENIYVYGIGGEQEMLQQIQGGALSGTVQMDIPAQVEKVLTAVQEFLSGGTPEKICYINLEPIDGIETD